MKNDHMRWFYCQKYEFLEKTDGLYTEDEKEIIINAFDIVNEKEKIVYEKNLKDEQLQKWRDGLQRWYKTEKGKKRLKYVEKNPDLEDLMPSIEEMETLVDAYDSIDEEEKKWKEGQTKKQENKDLDDEQLEGKMKETFEQFFPEGIEGINKIGEKISKKINFHMDANECANSYVDFKTIALLSYHNMKYDVIENLHYIMNYIAKKCKYHIDLPSCRNFVECAMSCDQTLCSIMNNYGFYSIYEDKIPEKELDENFGYSIDNPIKLPGIGYNKLYLDKLIYTKSGEHIRYNRIKGIPYPKLGNSVTLTKWYEFFGKNGSEAKVVDEYEILDQKGNYITTLYVCPYYNGISSNAPMGFILAKD